MNINELVRPNILQLKPYSSARSEYKGRAEIFLDANENPYESPYNRYPDPLQWKLKERIGQLKQVAPKNIFLGNGSDEVIDLLIRIFCEPAKDHIIILPPTYGMYQVSAGIADIEVKEVLLNSVFQPDADKILKQSNQQSKLLFLCSPNNPTGNSFSVETIDKLAASFPGITVVDEAYIDFSAQKSCIALLEKHPRLVVMQTFSKAWGMAGIRLGMAFASEAIISLLNKVKPPYNINQLTQDAAARALEEPTVIKQRITQMLGQRTLLQQYLSSLGFVKRIYPSDANFILLKVDEPQKIYQYLVDKGIIVRDRSKVALCEGCLRITVGTPKENKQLFQTLLTY